MIDIQNEYEITSNVDFMYGKRRYLNARTNTVRETRSISASDFVGDEYEEYGETIRNLPYTRKPRT